MEDQNRNASFSLARPFPTQERFSKESRSSSGLKIVQNAEKGETECDPQVVAAESQAEETLDGDDSFVSDSSTQVGDIESQTPHVYDSQEKVHVHHTHSTRLDLSGKAEDEATAEPEDRPINFWASLRLKVRRPLAEWLGTTIFMFIGICGNLSVITSEYKTGNMQSMYWCWGFAVMLAIYIAGGGSGAFLNPALTIMLAIFRGFPAKRIPVYIVAQILGSFTGALMAFAIYRDDILHLDGALIPSSTGLAFYTQPKDWVQPSTAFFCEMLGTAFISCSILALGDSSNSPPGAGMHALIIGLLTTTTTMSLGFSTGGCFNPARDMGPRLATIAVGYPTSLFMSHQQWWIWGPWCATITGALFGALVYDLCIFSGRESPVNHSCGIWKDQEVKPKPSARRRVRDRRESSINIERQLEAGDYGQHSTDIIELYFEPDEPANCIINKL